MASRREYEMLFKLSAQLGGNYSGTFKSAQSAVASMQKEIEALSRTQSDISAYQKQQSSVDATKKRLDALQQQYNNLQRELKATGGSSADLQNKLLAKQMQIDKTSASLGTYADRLQQTSAALKNAGVSTDNLTKESTELSQQINTLKQKQMEAADESINFGTAATAALDTVSQALVAAGIAKTLEEIYNYFLSCADASVEFESALTGVAKTTDFSDDELAEMSQSIKNLSLNIPATTKELSAIEETAGQLGIAKDSLLDFTEVMAMLGTATNMTSDEAATMLAQFASITGMDPSLYQNLGSAIVGLGNNYSTTERNITNMSQSIAAAGSISGMSEADIVGIAAAVTSLGITAENGATQMSKLISDINSTVSSGNGLKDWADVANMTADEFTDAWGNNAAGALDVFIRGLNEAYLNGQDVYGMLANLGITETRMVTMITSLAKSGSRLTDTLKTSNDAWKENTALTTEAEKRYSTTASELVLMQNAYNNLQIAIGDNFTPELRKLYELGADVLNELTQFIQQNPGLVKAAAAFAAIVGVTVLALTGYAAAAKMAAAASALLTAAIPGVNVIMAVVVGVAALTAGTIFLYEASKNQLDESWKLTAASREQYKEIQTLNTEYEKAVSVYGETSYEAQQLRWQLEELNAEYETGKQTLDEYKAAHEELIKRYDDMASSHDDAAEKIDREQRSVVALIDKLVELTSTSEGAHQNQQAILAIVDALNESVPNLALSYDDVANASSGYINSLYDIAKAQSDQLTLGEKWSEYIDRVGENEALKSAKEAAEYNAQVAQSEYDLAYKAYMDAQDLYKYDENGLARWWGTREEGAALDAAKEQLDTFKATIAEKAAALEENQKKVTELEGAFRDYQSEQDEATANSQNMRQAVKDVTDEMGKLSEAYTKAYDAAVASIEGQYALWDKASNVVATSVWSINDNIMGQISYWEAYNKNLDDLSQRSGEISGLNEMINSFADGSSDSVNAIAGMANASDADLSLMVSNWQKLKEEQKDASSSLADVKTGFNNAVGEMKSELDATVAQMNLSDDAAESARQTMQGFIDGAKEKMPEVQEAYKKIAQSAIEAIDAKLDIHSPSRVMMEKAEMTWAGYINQTKAMESEVAAAMMGTTDAGMDAFSAEEAQYVTLAPQLVAYLNARGGGSDAITAEAGTSGGVYITIEHAPHYELSGVSNAAELETVLREHDQNFRDYILEVMEDAGVDLRRRKFS